MSSLRRHIMMQQGGGSVSPFVDGTKLFIIPLEISGNMASYLYIYSIKFTGLVPQNVDTCIYNTVDRDNNFIGVRMYLTPDGDIKITRGTTRPEEIVVLLEDVNLEDLTIEGTFVPSGWGSLTEYTYNDSHNNIITKQFRMSSGYGYKGLGAYFRSYTSMPLYISDYSAFESCQISMWSLYGWTQGVGTHHHCFDVILNKDEQKYYKYNRAQEVIESGDLVLYQA